MNGPLLLSLIIMQEAPLDPAQTRAQQRLKSLRKSPGFRLIAHSQLFLHAWQMEMDYPPPLRTYVRTELDRLLKQKIPGTLSPDTVYIRFTTEHDPAIANDGSEHFSLRLSLTELGMACFDSNYFLALTHCQVDNDALSPAIPGLSASALLEMLSSTSWDLGYDNYFSRFWSRHEKTYRALSKLAFLDQLARQHSRKKISHEGYQLALETLGLKHYPTSPDCMTEVTRGQQAELHMLSVNGDLVPGIFQLRSKTTSHCFIHILGSKNVTEYISDDPRQMTARLLDALRAASGLVHLPDADTPWRTTTVQGATLVEGDLFDALARAQKHLGIIDESHDALGRPIIVDVLKPIKRSLALVSAVDIWNVQPQILRQIPVAERSAGQLMRNALFTRYGLLLNPNHVFIRYLPGTSTTPLGDARHPVNHVHVPDPQPINLGTALINNYRVEHPEGYIDHGGRSVVYLDPTGKGEWAAERALTISAEDIEDTVKSIDFLALMSGQVIEFWDRHKDDIEQAFRSGLIAQAVIGLKSGNLTRSGFDKVVKAMEPARDDRLQWRALGFNVYSILFDGVQRQYCAGLLLLEEHGKPGMILYQAGRPKAFKEFQHREQLISHLRSSAADEAWRQSVLDYVPGRHRERLAYLLKVWGGQPPDEAVSLLRPWAEVIHNTDVQDARANRLYEKPLSEPPFVFMHRTLKSNELEDIQTQIVTSREVSLRYWTRHLSHLQLLLAPMSLLFAPGAIASLAIELGILSLDIASANLPGYRGKEKQQVILTVLSLGLLELGPATPRLLQSLKNLGAPRRVGNSGGRNLTIGNRAFSSVLNSSMQPRKTHLDRFFHTDSVLKTWNVPGHLASGRVPVKAWKLERRFLLWTSNRKQANTLLVSTHGQSLPWSRTTAIPNGTDIYTYAPDGHILIDPNVRHVANRRVKPFAISNNTGNTPVPPLPPLVMTDKVMAGTSTAGRLKNYTVSKFQNAGDIYQETYDDICDVVSNSNSSPFRGQLPPTPIDVLTVRNRFGMRPPNLEELFTTLAAQGIHYDKILLVHCRCTTINALLKRAPSFVAPSILPQDHPDLA